MSNAVLSRKEKRNSQKLQLLLSSAAESQLTEPASTENVSPHGLRVRTDRPWEPNTRVLVKSSEGEFLAYARVVYCQTLPASMFALGLNLLVRTGD